MSNPKKPTDIEINNESASIKFSKIGMAAVMVRTVFDYFKGVPSGATLAELLKAVELKEPKEKQAFELVAKSLALTIRRQLGEDYDDQEALSYNFQIDIIEKLEKEEYIFNCRCLKNPSSLTFLSDFKKLYKNWLQDDFDFPEENRNLKLKDFTKDFEIVFFEELKAGKSKSYDQLLDWCNDPITADWERTIYRRKYKFDLKNKYNAPALGERKVLLSNVYIEPTFMVFDGMYSQEEQKEIRVKFQKKEADKGLTENNHFFPADYEGSIHDYFLNHFLEEKQPDFTEKKAQYDRLMILMGQPGHGKSSFCYRCMNDLYENDFNGNYFFIRLQDDSQTMLSSPLEGVKNLLEKHKIDFDDWIKTDTQKNVLFLDGLDEMYMVQSLSDDQVLQFIHNCKSLLNRYKNLYIVITSRFNYVETSKLHNDCILFSLGNLNTEQQQTFIEKYKAAKGIESCNLDGKTLVEINEQAQFEHVKELIELPILLQMILISKVNVLDAKSKAAIYNELFKTVLTRKWSNDKRLEKYKSENDFKPEHLRAYMSLLAFKIFQNNRGYLKKREIEGMKETKNFINKRLKIEGGKAEVKDILKDVLTSFYIKETRREQDDYREENEDSDYAIEFLHKSLYEYLTCEYLWNRTKAFFLKKDDDGDIESYETNEVQKEMQKLFGKIRLREEMMEHLKGIIDDDIQDHQDLMQQMAKYLPKLIKEGFLYEYRSTDKCQYNAQQQELNCFHGFWVIFGQLNQYQLDGLHEKYFNSDWEDFKKQFLQDLDKLRIIEKYAVFNKKNKEHVADYYMDDELISEIEEEIQQVKKWVEEKDLKVTSIKYLNFENWLRDYFYKENTKEFFSEKIKSIKTVKVEISGILRSLAAERFSMKLNFDFMDFSEINFQNILISEINLVSADLSSIDLISADLIKADLISTNLINANLSRAYLCNANLSRANLSHVKLIGADLDSAYLVGANLSYVKLISADLRHSNLSFADISIGNLSRADLRYSNLSFTNLSFANLVNADLINACLTKADLSFAVLSCSNLSFADLRKANLLGANLENSVLVRARVDRQDWIKWLKTQKVIGMEYVENKYYVSKKKKMFRNSQGEKHKAYEVLEK